MRIVFDKKYLAVYSSDPASTHGRLDTALEALKGRYEFVKPDVADEEVIRLNHSPRLISLVREDDCLYEAATLAVGGAILSADMAVRGHPSFALIRPPGHHASPDSHWGFCYFNNMAIAIKRLLVKKIIERALIIDFDLHYGDGTANSFIDSDAVTYFHPEASTPESYRESIHQYQYTHRAYDLLGVSAGFDRGINDWGGMLADEDYTDIGDVLKEISREWCEGRRFAVLEGGYNHKTLGGSIISFLRGFE